MIAIGAKLDRFDNQTRQYTQNRFFESSLKKLFDKLQGKVRENIVFDAEKSKTFLSEICDQQETHNENVEWLKKI